ncbi:MAG: septum formation inhibitor Maf [Clostridia bacterium]|nr:septum formation inhibitor Maf [Clostridia bacterium]
MLQLVLASASPRRRELLERLGIPFKVSVSKAEENIDRGNLTPEQLARELALLKAKDVARTLEDGLVIGADTIVVLDDEILGKPKSREEAGRMLHLLSGRSHQVITGLALVEAGGGRVQLTSEVTTVWFRRLDPGEVEWYLDTGEPMDKAGAYGIQGKGSILVDRIEGCYFNVVGLPLTRLYLMLKERGYRLSR